MPETFTRIKSTLATNGVSLVVWLLKGYCSLGDIVILRVNVNTVHLGSSTEMAEVKTAFEEVTLA